MVAPGGMKLFDVHALPAQCCTPASIGQKLMVIPSRRRAEGLGPIERCAVKSECTDAQPARMAAGTSAHSWRSRAKVPGWIVWSSPSCLSLCSPPRSWLPPKNSMQPFPTSTSSRANQMEQLRDLVKGQSTPSWWYSRPALVWQFAHIMSAPARHVARAKHLTCQVHHCRMGHQVEGLAMALEGAIDTEPVARVTFGREKRLPHVAVGHDLRLCQEARRRQAEAVAVVGGELSRREQLQPRKEQCAMLGGQSLKEIAARTRTSGRGAHCCWPFGQRADGCTHSMRECPRVENH